MDRTTNPNIPGPPFLAHAAEHWLYPLFLLIAHLGLRRGEACGLCWSDVDVNSGTVQIRRQLVQVDGRCQYGEPKTEAGYRTLGLATPLVAALTEHCRHQYAEHRNPRATRDDNTACAPPGEEPVFTTATGTPVQPCSVPAAFKRLVHDVGLPPIRLHDLRHGAATQALAAGVDIKTISYLLGHADVAVTLDVYASVTDETLHAAAEAIADRISTAAPTEQPRRASGDPKQ